MPVWLTCIITYVVLGHVLALFLLRFLRKSGIGGPTVLLLGLGLAPGVVSLLLYFLFLVVPSQPGPFYVAAVLALFGCLLAFSAKRWRLLQAAYRSVFTRQLHPMYMRLAQFLAFLPLLAAVLWVCYVGILFPIQGGDALQHATLGRILAEDRSLEHFPMSVPASSGFNTNVRYPPGLHCLYAWSYLLQGPGSPDVAVRVIAPLYFTLTLLLASSWANALRKGSGWIAAFACAMTPYLAHQVAGNSIDAMRIFFCFAALFATYWYLRKLSVRLLLFAALNLAMAPFVHTHGLIMLPVAGLGLLGFSSGRWLSRKKALQLRDASVLLAIAGGIGTFEYFRRLIAFGSWRGPTLSLPLDMQTLVAGRGFTSLYEILSQGVFGIFTQVGLYGLSAWLFLILPFCLFRRTEDRKGLIFLILCTTTLAVLTWLSPLQPPGWANVRYILIVVPFLATGTAILVHRTTTSATRYIDQAFCPRRTQVRDRFQVGLSTLISLSAKLLPFLVLFAAMTFIRFDNYLWIKTGGKGTSYGFQVVLLGDQEKLTAWGRADLFASVFFLNENIPDESLVLTTSEDQFFYYGTRDGISWQDLRLQPFHEAKSSEEAASILRELGVTHIQLSNLVKTYEFYEFPYSATFLEEIICDPTLSTLLWGNTRGWGTTIYELKE